LLIDISPELVEKLRQLYAADPCIRCSEGDCRDMKDLKDGCASLVIDKGTLDALCGEEDKVLMLRVGTSRRPYRAAAHLHTLPTQFSTI
jgi:hypothetical protein